MSDDICLLSLVVFASLRQIDEEDSTTTVTCVTTLELIPDPISASSPLASPLLPSVLLLLSLGREWLYILGWLPILGSFWVSRVPIHPAHARREGKDSTKQKHRVRRC